MRFRPPKRPAEPTTLTDDRAKKILSRSELWARDSYGTRKRARRIGWKRLEKGTLGAIGAIPGTTERYLFAICFKTGRPFCVARLG